MGMKLEVAAGDRPTPGFVHHDARPLNDIEIVCDMWDLLQHVETESCDEIRATHILEHFGHRETRGVLFLWHRLLVRGGSLYIEVPNLTWQAQHVIINQGDYAGQAEIVRLIFGDQDYEGNFHKTAFTETLLAGELEKARFVNISTTDIGAVIIASGVKVS